MDINGEIPYSWNFYWYSSDGRRPVVNRLLKAIIEKNVNEMESLFSKGATLDKIDVKAFECVWFYVVSDYNVTRCLVNHGFTALHGPFENVKCWKPETTDAYQTSPLGEALLAGRYDTMELLAQNGFDAYQIRSNGCFYNLLEIIIQRNDIRAMMILLSYGFPREDFERKCRKYPYSEVTRYLAEHPLIKRKTLALDSNKYGNIRKPNLEKEGLFNKKKIRTINNALMEDYQDRIEAQRRLRAQIGEVEWDKIQKENIEHSRLMEQLYDDVMQGKFKL